MKPFKEKLKVKEVLCFYILVVSFSLLSSCVGKNSSKNKEVRTSYTDITTLTLIKGKDSICDDWKEPNDSLVIPILKMMKEINSYEWNQYFGVFECKKTGYISFNKKNYKYELNAGGWIILYDSINDNNRYFGMKNKKGKKYFISIMFNEDDKNWK